MKDMEKKPGYMSDEDIKALGSEYITNSEYNELFRLEDISDDEITESERKRIHELMHKKHPYEHPSYNGRNE